MVLRQLDLGLLPLPLLFCPDESAPLRRFGPFGTGSHWGGDSGAPDITVEVVSPSDTAAELGRKASEYLEAGSQRVWVVYPESRRGKVYRPDGTAQCYSGDDAVTDEELPPGFP